MRSWYSGCQFFDMRRTVRADCAPDGLGIAAGVQRAAFAAHDSGVSSDFGSVGLGFPRYTRLGLPLPADWHGTFQKRWFLRNEPIRKMLMYLGMNVLGKIGIGFVLQKRGKKREINAGKQRREGGFAHERTQIGAPYGGGWGQNGPKPGSWHSRRIRLDAPSANRFGVSSLTKSNGGKRAACPAKNRTRAAREVLKLYQHIGSLFSRGLSHTPDGPRSFGGKICLWAVAGLQGMIREWPL